MRGLDRSGLGRSRANREYFFFCGLEDLDVVVWLQFSERFGDGGFPLVLFLQICRRVRIAVRDPELWESIQGENRETVGGFGWFFG